MKRIAPLGFAVSALALATACSGGYNVIAPSASPGATTQANVVFLVTVPAPSAANATRKPSISAPAGTQSVSVSLQSVNGTAVTGSTPTTQNIASGATGCTTAGNQLVCQFTVSATAGSDVFLMKTFGQPNAQGSATGAGNVSVNSTNGQNTIAPTVLTGTVASIALSAPLVGAGASGSYPLVISAKDASGNTILGQYANPITLSVTDASNHTTLSGTAVADSTAGTTIMVKYDGGAMSQAATISASASGVAASAITPAKFLPDESYPTVNGAATTYSIAVNGTSTSNGPYSQDTTETQTTATNASYNGLSNLVAVTATYSPAPVSQNTFSLRSILSSSVGTDYYQWTPNGAASNFQHVGFQGSIIDGPPFPVSETCTAPYSTTWVLPLPASWDAYAGTGACTTTVNIAFFTIGTLIETNNADGSYLAALTESNGPGGSLTESYTVNPDGSAISKNDSPSGSMLVTLGTPAPQASTIPITIQTFTGSIPSPVPSAAPTTIPNWYANVPALNGKVPSPLLKDVYTRQSAPASLPAACNVSASLVPAGATIAEVDEAYYDLDPISGYQNTATKWYLVNGIGMVCGLQTFYDYYSISGQGQSSTDSSESGTITYSLNATSLQAAMARTRSFAAAYPAAQAGLLTAAHHDQLAPMRQLLNRVQNHQ